MVKGKQSPKREKLANRCSNLRAGLKKIRSEVSQLLEQVVQLAEEEPRTEPSTSASTDLSPEALQLVQLCLDNDLHERLGSLVMSWETGKVESMVQSWSPMIFAVVCRPWSAQFTANLLKDRSARWITSVCESMNVDEIAQLLPLLKKKAKLVMGKLYFSSDDPFLSRDECKEIMNSLTEDQRAAVVRKYGTAASDILESDDSMADDESQDDNDPSLEEYDNSFIDDDEDVGAEDDDSDEDYVAD